MRKYQLIKVETSALFVSDTHLSEDSPAVIDQFNSFIENHASQHDFLFILGDLFEYWIGDDANQFNSVVSTLQGLKSKIYFIPGNRDFLIGPKFLKKTNIIILEDPTLIQLGNQEAVILHGDTLCIDDKEYQDFRTVVRSEKWKKDFINQEIDKRLEICKDLRIKSSEAQKGKSDILMDVNEDEVKKLFKDLNFPQIMIHGHTHRPKKHEYLLDNNICNRWVLDDWYDSGSYLVWKGGKLHTESL